MPTRSFATTHVFSAILGGGMASRLFQELRESRGLCYSIYSFYWPFEDTGVFGIQAATSEDDVAELVPLVLDEFRKMTDGVTAAELQRAKAQLRAGLLMTLESPLARAGQIARHILVHGRPLTLEEMVAKSRCRRTGRYRRARAANARQPAHACGDRTGAEDFPMSPRSPPA